MIITCDKCKTRYKMDESLINVPKFRARCHKCHHAFLVTHPGLQQQTAIENNTAPKVGKTTQTKISAGMPGWHNTSQCHVMAVCNQKGGVAKTTTCINLGASLTLMGKKVLLIDFDIQANMSMLLDYKDAKSFFDVIHNNDDGNLADYVIKTRHDFWLLPANSKMALLSKKYMQEENFSTMLRDKLEPIKHHFDYILIDTPPSGDFYTLNALLASDMAIIPTQCEYLSLNGVSHIHNMINVIKTKSEYDIGYRILITLYEQSSTVCNVVLNKLKEQYPGKMLKTIIEKDFKIQESQIAHSTMLDYNKESMAALQYQHLAKEVTDINKPQTGEYRGMTG